jgi:hypothetical protein
MEEQSSNATVPAICLASTADGSGPARKGTSQPSGANNALARTGREEWPCLWLSGEFHWLLQNDE